MDGACSNQIVKCIIYTSDIKTGQTKLAEIEEEKLKHQIFATRRRCSNKRLTENEVRFSDGEEWILVPADGSARGYRWRKAWVDVQTTTVVNLYAIVFACGDLYKWEDAKYFNWEEIKNEGAD